MGKVAKIFHPLGLVSLFVVQAKILIQDLWTNAVLSNANVNDEEMTTAFIGVEALSNSHPLTYQSAHPKDTSPLMPNHLLHGQIGESTPEIDEMYFIGIWLDKTLFRSLISQRGGNC